jgi:glycosyltransferase involved in cell wall biosynthesis
VNPGQVSFLNLGQLGFLAHEWPPVGGGAGVVGRRLFEALRQMGWNAERMGDCSVPWRPWAGRGALKRLVGPLVCNDLLAAASAGLWLSEAQLARAVVLMHGLEPEQVSSSWRLRLSGTSWGYRRALARAGAVVCVSDALREKARRAFPQVLPERWRVVEPGLGACWFLPPEDTDRQAHERASRNRHGLPSTGKILLTVARLTLGKGFAEMARLFADLLRVQPDWCWVIVGEGDERVQVQRILAEAGVSGRSHLLGALPEEELPGLFAQADLFCLLSGYDEGWGLVFAEAASQGLASLGWDKGGMRSSVRNGVTGFLAPDQASALAWIVDGRWRELDRGAMREFARGFTAQRQAARITELLEELERRDG